MDEKSAFLRRICEEPDEDVHRLVYADWLDENGESERAEFIRVQVELEPIRGHADGVAGHVRCEACEQRYALVCREQSLLFGMHASGQTNGFEWSEPPLRLGIATGDYELYRFTRGFVSHVTLTQGDFLRHARDIFAAHPVTAVTLSDRSRRAVLHFTEQGTEAYGWTTERGWSHRASWIEEALWEHMDFTNIVCDRDGYRCWDTQADALAALSAACVAYGRKLADLPALVTAASRPAASRG